MATLLLTAVGTAVGGPIGGAIGALVGQQADRALFSGGGREGPRLKELAVTTSSYGQPIPRHFGRMRVAGTVIWATDLEESSSTEGGKGKPKTTTYSYSANFAVALSSTPIARVGRIWADGTLLRGAADDLKVEGELRVYTGAGDNAVDPIIAADRGAEAPAFRDCAYVVFEGLQLADFGNRIPALTFEVFGQTEGSVELADLVPQAAGADLALAHTLGFADEGGSLGSTLSAIDAVFPLTCATSPDGLRIASAIALPEIVPTLPEQLSDTDSETASERPRNRGERLGEEPMALRYYDEARDYQPGVQRAIGSRAAGRELMLDLPAAMNAEGAKQLANDNAHRARWHHERMTWRIGQVDPSVEVGGVVRLPDRPGLWRVLTWEWYDRGVELGLERLAPGISEVLGSDTGLANLPADIAQTPTVLELFELPAETSEEPSVRHVMAAVSSRSPAWRGAALYTPQGSALVPLATAASRRAVLGYLAEPLSSSPSHLFEPTAFLDVTLIPEDMDLQSTDMAGLASGANRLLVGAEILQFAHAEPHSDGMWRLTGLLRGRAGTEEFAAQGHAASQFAVLLDDRLTSLNGGSIAADATARVAAIGRGDSEPVFASLSNAGLSRRPLSPVHPSGRWNTDGSLDLCWTRRARGQWVWSEASDVPLVEEQEAYTVGFGAVETPDAAWSVNEPRLTLSASELTALIAAHGSGDLWVRQNGTFSSSSALLLTTLT